MNMPSGARAIVKARTAGQKPADGVIVSFVGQTDLEGHHVFARSGEVYDWRFLRGLDVSIVVKAGVDARDAMRRIFSETLPTTGYPWIVDTERKELAYLVRTKPMEIRRIRPGSETWQGFFA